MPLDSTRAVNNARPQSPRFARDSRGRCASRRVALRRRSRHNEGQRAAVGRAQPLAGRAAFLAMGNRLARRSSFVLVAEHRRSRTRASLMRAEESLVNAPAATQCALVPNYDGDSIHVVRPPQRWYEALNFMRHHEANRCRPKPFSWSERDSRRLCHPRKCGE